MTSDSYVVGADGYTQPQPVVAETTELEKLQARIPEPAMIRAAVVSVLGIASVILGYEIDVAWLDPILNVFTVASPLVLGFLIRQKVTPVSTEAPSTGKHAA